jgi:group I intron endonuclease
MTNTNIGIYELTHIDTGRTYIGASQSMKSRDYHHLRRLHLGHHEVPLLQADFNESASGNTAISIAVLEYCTFDQLGEREDFHIKAKERAYNSSKGGGGLRIVTDEHREKMRKRLTGKQMHFTGYYQTPWGVFPSTIKAAAACPIGISSASIWNACKTPEKVISAFAYAKSLYLQANYDKSVIGNTWADLGFSFEAKSADDTGIKSYEVEDMSADERAKLIDQCNTDLADNLDEMRHAASQIGATVQSGR